MSHLMQRIIYPVLELHFRNVLLISPAEEVDKVFRNWSLLFEGIVNAGNGKGN